jgi:hypothetical protein
MFSSCRTEAGMVRCSRRGSNRPSDQGRRSAAFARMGLEPSKRRGIRDWPGSDGRPGLENDSREPRKRDRFVRKTEVAVVLRGCLGPIESIPTVAGRHPRRRPSGLRMKTEGSRDREKGRYQQDELCGTSFSEYVEHLSAERA